MALAPPVAPPTFVASANALATETRAMSNLTHGMVDFGTDGSIPDEMEPVLETEGSMKRPTVSLYPSSRVGGDLEAEDEGITRGFDAERGFLQGLIDRHSDAHMRHGFPQSVEVADDIRKFLTRLVSVTGLPLSKVLGSESMEKAMEKLVWIGMVGGLRSFTILNVPAKRALNIYMGIEDEGGVKAKADPLDLPPGIRDDADLATRYFESAVCYMALTDEYAEEIVEGRFLVASTRFARAGYIDAAAMSSDLASRWWRPAPFKVPGEHQNPYHKQAAKLFAESLVRDPDAFTFGTRYLYGLYHAKKASDFATMQRFFGASSGYFKAMHNTYEAARAHIRQLWAFTQRRDIEAADWLAISGDLSSAIDLFTDSWLERDAKAVAKLRELSAMAIRLSGTT